MNTSWHEAALFHPATRRPLVPQLVDRLRHHIVLGTLREYDRLPPMRKLAGLFGVSLPTMREALQVLAYLGIVRIEQGAGTFVNRGPQSYRAAAVALRRATLEEMTNLRRILEIDAARQAATAASRPALADARDPLLGAAWERRVRRGGWPEDYVRTDLDFHCAVLVRGGDSFLALLHRETCRRLEATLMADASRQLGNDHLNELHERLYEAIGRQQPEYAARLAREIAEREAPTMRGAR